MTIKCLCRPVSAALLKLSQTHTHTHTHTLTHTHIEIMAGMQCSCGKQYFGRDFRRVIAVLTADFHATAMHSVFIVKMVKNLPDKNTYSVRKVDVKKWE